jgi:drug/metabolite transporter, DME family
MTLFSPPPHHRAAARLRVRLRPAAAATTTAAILWGTMGPVAALYPPGSALALSEMRLAIGAVALGLAALAGQGQAARWQRREIPAVVAGIVSVAGYSVLYFTAVELAGVASATVVAIGAAPLVAGLGHVMAGRGPLSRTWLVTTVAATAGIGLVVLPGALTSHSRVGIVLAFAAACCYALQAHSIHTLTRRHSPTMTVAVLFAGAAVLLCPLLPRGAALVSGSLPALAGVVYLGLFTTAAAYALFASGVRGTGAPTAVTLSLLEPVVAAVLGAVLVGQSLTPVRWIGIAVVIASLALLTRPTKQRQTKQLCVPRISSAALSSRVDPAPPARRTATAAAAPPESELGGPGIVRDSAWRDTERPPPRAAAAGQPGHDCALAPRQSPSPRAARPDGRPPAGRSGRW